LLSNNWDSFLGLTVAVGCENKQYNTKVDGEVQVDENLHRRKRSITMKNAFHSICTEKKGSNCATRNRKTRKKNKSKH
jgi:hypothetical protein